MSRRPSYKHHRDRKGPGARRAGLVADHDRAAKLETQGSGVSPRTLKTARCKSRPCGWGAGGIYDQLLGSPGGGAAIARMECTARPRGRCITLRGWDVGYGRRHCLTTERYLAASNKVWIFVKKGRDLEHRSDGAVAKKMADGRCRGVRRPRAA